METKQIYQDIVDQLYFDEMKGVVNNEQTVRNLRHENENFTQKSKLIKLGLKQHQDIVHNRLRKLESEQREKDLAHRAALRDKSILADNQIMKTVGGNIVSEVIHKVKEIHEDLEDDLPSREDHSKKLMIECYYIHGHAALEYARKIPNTLQRQFLAKKNRDLRM